MSKKETISIAGVLALFLLIGTFADLSISKAIYSPGTWFPHFFEVVGEAPGIFVGIFCCGLLIITRDTSAKVAGMVQLVLLSILLLALSLMSAFQIFHYMDREMGIGTVVLAAGYVVACVFLSTKVDQRYRGEIRQAAVIGLLLIVFALASVNIIKIVWGRPRFRSMQDDLSAFVPWYLPQARAAGEEFKSFPSGHSANAAIIIWITMLPRFMPQLADRDRILKAIAYGWTLCVMISRIMAGAHFLSDVAVGVGCTLLGFVLLKRWIKVKA